MWNDTFVEDARDNDIIILVMGATGAGKSSFINAVAGKDALTVCHSPTAQSAIIEHVIVPHPDDAHRRVVFVETPGFDDTYLDDSEILRYTAGWLADSYNMKKEITGIIYLHEITQTRNPSETFRAIQLLCGESVYRNMVLATTKWSNVAEARGKEREGLLCASWKGMLDLGSSMCRFLGTRDSGWDIVLLLLDKQPILLQIQAEMRGQRSRLAQTHAHIMLVQKEKKAKRRKNTWSWIARLWSLFSRSRR
ncbi:hypothetical protein BV22DRAFT_1134845 [Leucogyrophana mollusca]|uniref:Uncharacterized protein n=1 Tax=Leucogyrophana mollusca TaxID=85980 RepID=A0ACB8AXS4_9AGAM|nr:hypothetical protein BV22DRAFT_1134845 [Leucogyrophana mollusca]